MPADRFVRWKGHPPKRALLELVILDYIDDAGEVHWHELAHRFYITLRGKHSEVARRAGLTTPNVRAVAVSRYHEGDRLIEVYVDPEYADVITRMTDDYTSGVAERLAEVLARLFDGEVESN